MHPKSRPHYFLSLSAAYFSQPSCSKISAFCNTSSSSDLAYFSISTVNLGMDVPRMRIASKAALVELLIPDVATGIPRYVVSNVASCVRFFE